MKAIVCTQYGPPSNLQLQEVPKPSPKANEVLVKVHATAVNDYEWSFVRGKPYVYRLMFGLRKPKNPIPGMEVAGTVEALGVDATKFSVGDAVYGDLSDHGFGSFAEYICVKEEVLTLKPERMTFEEATAIPHASMLAVQGLIDIGQIQQNQRILVNGAGGGVGTFALQIAKQYGAEVTGVDTGEKLQMMLDLGFDHVIDYKQTDFTRTGQQYDLVLDAKTNRSPFRYLRALKPQGKYVTVGGHLSRLFQVLFWKPWISWFSQKSVHILALKANKDLGYIHELFEAGKIRPVIDGPYPLEEAPQAIQRFGEGKHGGKVVIGINSGQIA